MKNQPAKLKYALILLLLASLVLIDRFVLLNHFTLSYVDDDQAIMWHGALEFSKGNFHEPYFFGQPYNTMLESLAAVPLIKMGLSYPFSLTLVMSLFTLLPFFLYCYVLFRKEKFLLSLLVMAIPLLLPAEFGMITAISRGTITGVFLAFFGLLSLESKWKWKFVCFGFFSALGVAANPNAIVLVFPVAVMLLPENFKNVRFYLQVMAGSILPLVLWYLAGKFYKDHPEYIVHGAWPLNFDTGRLRPADWAKFFGFVTPGIWYTGLALFPLLVLLAVFAFRQRNRMAAYGIIAAVLIILFALTSNKVHDGYDTVFYSCGRMFVAVPFLLALFVVNIRVDAKLVYAFLSLAIIAFVFKQFTVAESVRQEVSEKKEHNMYVADISELTGLCKRIKQKAYEQKAGLIVIGKVKEKHLINYACPCLVKNFPETVEPELDRRTWKLKELDLLIYPNVLFAGFSADAIPPALSNHPAYAVLSDSVLMMSVRNNKLSTSLFLKELGLPMRRH